MMQNAFRNLAILAGIMVASAAQAQDTGHQGHHDHAPQPVPAAPAPASDASVDHGAMDHGNMDHGNMDHGNMDHGTMDHAASPPAPAGDAEASPGPTMETPPPPEAGSGPPRAADAIWGAEAMREARHREHGAHGDFPVLWVQADRLEAQVRQGADGFLWDVQGYYGGPTRRLWLKSEGEGAFGEDIEQAEVQALWSSAISPYWDIQLGVRQDLAGPATTHAVIGFQGLAPYMFEVDGAAFVSHRGDITARVEVELDQRLTQRLILQPRVELGLSAQDIPELGVGAGLDKAEAGLRLRYEITREFAPYIGVEQSWRLGKSADYARAAGDDPSATSLVVGVRLWF